mmetsp:Transcript_20430/g.58082  ORF Transcript_20430/g.58082 Transcript_20430/m.58082 type:complete len:201 (-) Transcript_20430:302-904(-)
MSSRCCRRRRLASSTEPRRAPPRRLPSSLRPSSKALRRARSTSMRWRATFRTSSPSTTPSSLARRRGTQEPTPNAAEPAGTRSTRPSRKCKSTGTRRQPSSALAIRSRTATASQMLPVSSMTTSSASVARCSGTPAKKGTSTNSQSRRAGTSSAASFVTWSTRRNSPKRGLRPGSSSFKVKASSAVKEVMMPSLLALRIA